MNPPFVLRRRRRDGFLLLEIILATIIFTVGVLSLGQCLTACLTAQRIRAQTERARMALENRMAEIQASPALPDETRRTKLKGMFEGMNLTEHRKVLGIKNENNVVLSDLHEIDLTVEWRDARGEKLSRSLAFDLLRGRG